MQMLLSPKLDTVTFDSWSEFTNFAENRTAISGSVLSSRTVGNSSFTGTHDFAETMRLANNGWPEGSAKIAALTSKLMDKVTSLVEHQTIQYDVTGNDFDLPMVLQGVPEHWFTIQSKLEHGIGFRIIHLVYSCSASGGVNKDILTAKGATIAALIESLEYAGFRVQLTVREDLTDSVREDLTDYRMAVSVPVKYAEQPLDIDRLAFALAHPSMLRRLIFSVNESSENFVKNANFSYGIPASAPITEQGDLYIDKSFLGEPQWADTNSTTNWILAELKKQGVHISE